MIKFFEIMNIRCIFADMKNRTYYMDIKKTVFALVVSVLLSSCASEYLIEGNSSVSRLDGRMLFMKIPSGDEMISVDSAEVVHGLFRMQGEVDTPKVAALYMDEQSIMPLVMEQGNIQIQIDNARIIVSGTPLNDKLYEFVRQKNSLDDRAYEVERMESRLIMDGESIDAVEVKIKEEREKLSKELDGLVKSFIQENYENVLGPGVFMMLCNGFPYPLLTPLIEDIVGNAPEAFQNNPYVKEYMEAARENMKNLEN